MNTNDVLLLTLYLISEGSVLYILFKNMKYYRGRFQDGKINQFMLAMLAFLVAYAVKMGVAFWIRISRISDGSNSAINDALQTYSWTAAQLLTTICFVILALLVKRNNFLVWFYLTREAKEADERRLQEEILAAEHVKDMEGKTHESE